MSADVITEKQEASLVYTEGRPALQQLSAGTPLLLTDEEIDLVELVNRADEVIETLLDLDMEPDEFRLAEMLIEHLCRRYGVERHGEGTASPASSPSCVAT